MTDPDAPPQKDSLDTLAAFLESPDLDDDVMMLPELDGFLAALAVGPQPVSPEEWLPLVWGESAPAFANETEAERVIGAIMARFGEIQAQVENGTFAPLFWLDNDGAPLPEDWAVVFMTAAGLREDAWRPLLESEDDDYILYPILAFCHDEVGNPLLELSKRDREALRAQAPEFIATAVLDIAEHWGRRPKSPPPQPVRVEARPGRNDPCSCGSGKKYKKCCGRSA